MLKPTINLLFCLFFAGTLWSQQAKQYAFTRYYTGGGLLSNYVNSIVQDGKGFMWVGSISGLQRYDGHKFLSFKNQRGNPFSIPSDNVTSLYRDKQGEIWLATGDDRVGIFNNETFTYHEVPIVYRQKTAINISTPRQFSETDEGQLLLCIAGDGIYVLDKKAGNFISADGVIKAPAGWKINELVQEPGTRRFWVAADSGLAVFDAATRNLDFRGHNPDNDPVIRALENYRQALLVCMDDSNNVFLATKPFHSPSPWVYRYNRNTGYTKAYNTSVEIQPGAYQITGKLKQQNGRVWLYGNPFIATFTGAAKPFETIRNEYKDEQSIRFDRVNYMYEDRERSIWICTDNGLFLFNSDAQEFTSYFLLRPGGKDPLETAAQSVLQLNNGQLWVGSKRQGLYCYDKNFIPSPSPAALRKITQDNSIGCMVQQRGNGLVWMGLQAGGLAVYNPANSKAETFSPAIAEGQAILQVVEDRRGDIWLGTEGGLVIKWDHAAAGGNIKIGYSVVQKGGLVYKIITDTRGLIWVATGGTGLYAINPASGRTLVYRKDAPPGKQLFSDSPSDIVQYNDSLMVIANGALDVLNTRTGRIWSITDDEGLPSNHVLCLQKDVNGILWLGLPNGLCRMNFEKQLFIFYDRQDGITYDNFNPAGAFQLQDGKLVFTTNHNFLVFDPSAMVPKSRPPDVKIFDFLVANNPLLVDSLKKLSKVTLDYSKTPLTIGFGTLTYLRKNKKVFFYQLENMDHDWIRSDDRHQATYTYLPPGNYTFKVKTVNAFGVPSQSVTTMVIYIKPPYWQTWWFYAMILLLVFGVIYLVDKERIRRLLALQQVRTEIAGNLHQDINSTLQDIHLLSEIAKIKADKDLVKSKEYIDQINNKSRRMMDAMDDILWSIDPENDSMEKTLDRMHEFAEGLKNRNDCRITMVVDEKVKSLKLYMKSRHELFLFFKEAMTCIMDYSNCTDSIINIDKVKSAVLIKIHDNGNSFDLKTVQGSSRVESLKNRASHLNAVLDVQSDKTGTSIILQVPVK